MRMNDKKLKSLEDGRIMLNLGCGCNSHSDWNNIDFSEYAKLRKHPFIAKILNKLKIITNKRYKKLNKFDPDTIIWDLRKGIPFDENTFDVVYNSHLLEHISRNDVTKFLNDILRVLKPEGIVRIVVPDLEYIINQYINAINKIKKNEEEGKKLRKEAVNQLFEQMVRKEPAGTSDQSPFIRFFERLVRGEASDTGELHRWMYDKYALTQLLDQVGFSNPKVMDPYKSQIKGWKKFNLDVNDDNTIYKPGSLYVEAIKEI